MEKDFILGKLMIMRKKGQEMKIYWQKVLSVIDKH